MKILTILSLFVALLLPQSINGEELPQMEPVVIGDLEILPIRDADTSMAKNLLPELAKYPEYESAFDKGPLPSVSQVYYLRLKDRKILFDTGWGNGKIQGHMLEILEKDGIKPGQITDILLTHLDIDHIGGLLSNDERVFPNATIWISRPEYEAWMKDEVNRSTELAKKTIAKYDGKIKLFEDNQEVLPGITAILTPGHTPGHASFEIASGNDKLVIGGDIFHIWQIQLEAPQLSAVYDNDPEKAAETRKKLLERISSEKMILAGSHFPMISPVIKREDGGFNMRAPR